MCLFSHNNLKLTSLIFLQNTKLDKIAVNEPQSYGRTNRILKCSALKHAASISQNLSASHHHPCLRVSVFRRRPKRQHLTSFIRAHPCVRVFDPRTSSQCITYVDCWMLIVVVYLLPICIFYVTIFHIVFLKVE